MRQHPTGASPLTAALIDHRNRHHCGLGCEEYLDIARRSVAARQIWEGPKMSHTWMSIREAQTV